MQPPAAREPFVESAFPERNQEERRGNIAYHIWYTTDLRVLRVGLNEKKKKNHWVQCEVDFNLSTGWHCCCVYRNCLLLQLIHAPEVQACFRTI